ncbi:Bug family tripartite tricarboxylate transporter substrate binding protein [Pollutimonas bauzanensis]|uniref:Tripartite-type tricarboxylate transporter, receptor component TctC n=1 Tax=Pollutimonas bauzanensis TaxID=658167 RepID=A0A1M5Q6H9_9BURK|nr:tripartite tricarboxylate transporter substrate binding protein [Pollutimonas bauzanensis]SHH09582.1 Tripartite-type tricarboxylate transporter, receptor component TctC [Pollutimonas bauzanensis]
MQARSNTQLKTLLKGGLIALALGVAGAAHAWPDRALKMIVPFPAGGINDTVARLTATHLGEELGATIVVENRAGAGGTIGTMAAASSPADGYTILLGASSTVAVAPSLYKKLGYAPEKDLVALGGIGSATSLLVVGSNSKWNSLSELVEADKKDPGTINYGSAGAGTSHHIKTEMLKLRTGAKWVHIPYRGGAPAMTDLMGGQIDFLLEPLPTALPYVESGRVKALGVTTLQRAAVLPDVKSFDEQGIGGFDATLWFGVFAPAGVDGEIARKIGDALQRVFARDAVKQDLEKRGLVTYSGSPGQFKEFVTAEIKLWGDVIQKAGIPAQ